MLLNDLATTLDTQGRTDEACVHAQRASDLARQVEHPELHVLLSNLAAVLTHRGAGCPSVGRELGWWAERPWSLVSGVLCRLLVGMWTARCILTKLCPLLRNLQGQIPYPNLYQGRAP